MPDHDPQAAAFHSDRQSQAFREASPEDRVLDEDLPGHAEAMHHAPPDGMPLGDLIAEIKLPDAWEAERWDAGRVGPKSLAEAREALAARIADSAAPDGPEVAGAYDDV